MTMSTEDQLRLPALERLKGIAITLVVLGHIVARDLKPKGNDWYPAIHEVIYSFPMALFFYLSSIVTYLHGVLPVRPSRYRTYLHQKCVRLLPAYLVFGAIVFIGKLAAAQVMQCRLCVDCPSDWQGRRVATAGGSDIASFRST